MRIMISHPLPEPGDDCSVTPVAKAIQVFQESQGGRANWSVITFASGFLDKLKTEALGQRQKAVGKIIPWQNHFAIELFCE